VAVKNYADLLAWQRAIDLVVATYGLTSSWPREEVFGLTAQARRAAISTATNIAEGQGRRSDREFGRFLKISHGSIRELETCVVISARLNFGSAAERDEVMRLAGEVGRLVTALGKKLLGS
jgi:four helix bundle protein